MPAPSRDQGHRGYVDDLLFDRPRHRGQPRVRVKDRRNGECRGELQCEAEKQGRRDDAGPGNRRNERVDLHGRDGPPDEKGEQFGDAVFSYPRDKIRTEEVRGRKRSDRYEQQERESCRNPPAEEEEGKEVRRRGQTRDVPEALQCVTASGQTYSLSQIRRRRRGTPQYKLRAAGVPPPQEKRGDDPGVPVSNGYMLP